MQNSIHVVEIIRLFLAIIHHKLIDTIQVLLNNKLNVNAEDSSNNTPFYCTMMAKNSRMAELSMKSITKQQKNQKNFDVPHVNKLNLTHLHREAI